MSGRRNLAHLTHGDIGAVRDMLDDGPTPSADELRAVLSNVMVQVLILQRQVNNLQADMLNSEARLDGDSA